MSESAYSQGSDRVRHIGAGHRSYWRLNLRRHQAKWSHEFRQLYGRREPAGSHQRIDPDARIFDLWVPEELTFEGTAITQEAAMAVVLDQLLARGFFPEGFDEAGKAGP
jgi:hypothetical protein